MRSCLVLLTACAAFAQAPQMQWVRQFGPTEGAVYDQGSAADANGSYYVAGWDPWSLAWTDLSRLPGCFRPQV